MNIRINARALAALVTSLALAAPAAAAPGPPLPVLGSPTGLSAGAFFPTSGAAKAGGSTQLDIEFRYAIPLPNPTPLLPVVGLGVETGSRSGNRSTVVPLTAGLLVGLNGLSPNAGGSIFAGGGVGVYFLNHHRSGSGLNQLGTSTRFGGYGELGYNLTGLVFVDAKYQIVDRANGVSASVGLRF